MIFGWVASATSEAERAALRLAVLGLAHNEVGAVARALVAGTRVAVHVRGFLDLGERAAVAAIEVGPGGAPQRGRRPSARLSSTPRSPRSRIEAPRSAELAAVKALLRARLQAEEKRAGTAAEPRDAALARLARVRELAEAVSGDELAALVKRVFAPGHRVAGDHAAEG